MKNVGLKVILGVILSVFLYAFMGCSSTKDLSPAEKEAKSLKKEGWEKPTGTKPLETQLKSMWEKTEQKTKDSSSQRYLQFTASSVAGMRNVAKKQAMELAKLDLAGSLESRIASLASTNIGNTQLADDEAESVSEFVQNSKNIISAELGYVDPALVLHKKLPNGNYKVEVTILYDIQQQMQKARQAVKKELENKVDANEEDLRKLMGM